MADLPIEEKKEVPFTTEQRLDAITQDVQELARGINTQARLLESIVLAFDHVVKQYLELTRIPDAKAKEETK